MAAQKPKTVAPQEQFIKLPRDLLRSVAWRSLGINERRFLDFLMLEHLRHGGRENGRLKAPYRQLAETGISACYAPAAIRNAEERGLIRCCRGGMRVATTYSLTWLPLAGGSVPTNDWRAYGCPETATKSRNLPRKGDAGLPSKGDADGVNLPSKGDADTPKTLHRKGDDLSRYSYQEVAAISVLESAQRPAAVPPLRASAAKAGAR